jgi:hypothetical protein
VLALPSRDERSGEQLGAGVAGAAGPHNRVPGFALQPISLTDFRFGRGPDQYRFAIVAFVDPTGVPDALRLRFAVASRERNVDDAWRHEAHKLIAIPCASASR